MKKSNTRNLQSRNHMWGYCNFDHKSHFQDLKVSKRNFRCKTYSNQIFQDSVLGLLKSLSHNCNRKACSLGYRFGHLSTLNLLMKEGREKDCIKNSPWVKMRA
ncbi:unnamed protein product [Blepharisma stoltei]|uniref:Uncharacterized protein n=1 Tax=Blepharisma stoltei TaxID=1481888 RepID=A0AAU9J1F9_9CILI|nr:unnamed protein product [Blepharisma stoltei]